MVSATPILTTKLPGIPKEYYDYIYLIEDESIEGIAKTLKDILNIDYKDRNEFGKKAQMFVLNNKSNIMQAKKIKEFLIHE